MDASSPDRDPVQELLGMGVTMPHPASVFVGPEVDPDRVSADGVTIHPGCRIRGTGTVISAGCTLGEEAPMTVDDCRLGPGVVLKGGYAAGSVFLAGAGMGSAAHVREGTILEEEASGAHCVGLKQTILFPFVTLGSLINFCDCLMSGGTSRSDHSEVGSSYIHFNFTPDGDKTTASLFGDVPRGVMLDRPPVFLGGQGGAVGPVRTGFGTVVAAGSILRSDVDEDGMLVTTGTPTARVRPMARQGYRNLGRIVERNLTYLANLDALEAWYRQVRRPFFAAQELGELVHAGALDALSGARRERAKRLAALAAKVAPDDEGRAEFSENVEAMLACFGGESAEAPTSLLAQVTDAAARGTDYVTAIQALPVEARTAGIAWLQSVVDERYGRAAALAPGLGLPGGAAR